MSILLLKETFAKVVFRLREALLRTRKSLAPILLAVNNEITKEVTVTSLRIQLIMGSVFKIVLFLFRDLCSELIVISDRLQQGENLPSQNQYCCNPLLSVYNIQLSECFESQL